MFSAFLQYKKENAAAPCHIFNSKTIRKSLIFLIVPLKHSDFHDRLSLLTPWAILCVLVDVLWGDRLEFQVWIIHASMVIYPWRSRRAPKKPHCTYILPKESILLSGPWGQIICSYAPWIFSLKYIYILTALNQYFFISFF